jgi:hypothetical protein
MPISDSRLLEPSVSARVELLFAIAEVAREFEFPDLV